MVRQSIRESEAREQSCFAQNASASFRARHDSAADAR
jgi:hypothetical protein